MKHRGLLPFFLLTFGYTWGLGVVYALAPDLITGIAGPMAMGPNWLVRSAVYAPSLAALAVAAFLGRPALRDLFGRLLRWRVGLPWYLAAIFGMAAICLAARFVCSGFTDAPLPALAPLASWPGLIGAAVLALAVDPGPLGEELGWRGFALPRLQARWNGLTSALVLGAIWGVWHLPAFLIPGLPQHEIPIWAFMVSIVSGSVLMTWVVNKASGSVLPAILMHWSLNLFIDLHPQAAPFTASVFALAALGVVLAVGPNLGASRASAI
jgi:membrane protease YdiL (CAAX protease family)